jgi:hypothetical protein
LYAGEKDFYKVVVPHPITADNPFASNERRELTCNAHAAGLVADDAILGEEAFADDFGIGRSRLGSAGAASHFGIVDIGLESTAIAGEVEAAPENEDSGENDEPERERGAFLGGLGGFTQNGS